MQNALLYALAVLIWGSTWYAQKFQIGPVDALLSVSYRFALAALLMALYGIARGKLRNLTLTRPQHARVALQGFLLFFLNYWFFYLATHHLTSGLIAVCFSTLPLMNGLNQRLLLKAPFRPQVVAGGALGVAGMIGVFWHEIEGFTLTDPRLFSVGLSLLAVYIASLGNVISLRNSRDGIPVFTSTALGMGWGALSAFAVALLTGTAINFDMSAHYLVSLAYLTLFGSVVAFMAFLTLVSRIGADRAGYVGVLTPIVALGVSTVFEGYHWTSMAALGIVLIVIGNILALRKTA